jgi:hypothetical protein
MKKSAFLIAGSILFVGIRALAHHVFAGTYLLDQTATIQGSVVQFDIRNPHSFMTVNVKDDNGKITLTGVEWGSVTELGNTGVTRQTLQVGDAVTIVGAPARDSSEHKLLMRKIVRSSDGWTWGDKPGEVIKNYAPSASNPAGAK